MRRLFLILIFMAIASLCSAQDPIEVTNTSCRVTDQDIVTVDITITGTVSILRDIENLRITSAFVGPARVLGVFEILGDFRAGQSTRFSVSGSVLQGDIDRNDLSCVVGFEWFERQTPDPDPDPAVATTLEVVSGGD